MDDIFRGIDLLANYMIDENEHITVFDFDECGYSWYATDDSYLAALFLNQR